MKNKEIKEVYRMAFNYEYPNDPVFVAEAQKALEGLAVDRTVRFVTKAQAACVLNYQCRMLNGEFDSKALQETLDLYRRYVRLLD